MALFKDLPEQTKIQHVKDAFVSLLERLVDDPAELGNYIDIDANKDIANKILELTSKMARKSGCLCGSCFSVDIHNGPIPSELSCLIDAARKEVEAKAY
jgi:hypothetical protein